MYPICANWGRSLDQLDDKTNDGDRCWCIMLIGNKQTPNSEKEKRKKRNHQEKNKQKQIYDKNKNRTKAEVCLFFFLLAFVMRSWSLDIYLHYLGVSIFFKDRLEMWGVLSKSIRLATRMLPVAVVVQWPLLTFEYKVSNHANRLNVRSQIVNFFLLAKRRKSASLAAPMSNEPCILTANIDYQPFQNKIKQNKSTFV